MEALMGGRDPDDPAALEHMMAMLGGMPGMPDMGGAPGVSGMGHLGGFGSGFLPPARAPPTVPKHAAADSGAALATLQLGDRVRVVEDRHFEGRFHSGMEGRITENDTSKNVILVHFDGRSDPLKVAYRHLEPASLPREVERPASTTSAVSGGTAGALSQVSVGDRVRVIAGRSFDKFHGGMVGRVHRNNADNRNMLVLFDNVAISGSEPLQVAYRHLELA
uniref:Uncharacterized protein n=1 Tax=Noctiluca scintillans TaxID=2966 RepID=A0A7S0ZVI8_NOCSC